MCRSAYEKKLFSIGFSAHVPIKKQTGINSEWNMKEEKLNAYVTEVQAAKKRWQGKLEVFLGLEADYIKGMRSALDNDIISLNLDYLIGSVHYVTPPNGTQPFTVDGPAENFEKGLREGFNGDVSKLMHSYYDAVNEMIIKGGFDILGHADLQKNNCQDKYFWSEDEEAKRQREIAGAAAKTGLVIEVNTGGITRKKIKDVYPSLSFLRIIKEFNIPVIITSDAHCSEDINAYYDTALQTLILADIKEHLIFIGKKNGKASWKKEKL